MQDFLIKETDLICLPPKKRVIAQNLLKLLKETLESDDVSTIHCPDDVYRLTADMVWLEHEEFVCLLLDTKNRVKKRLTLSVGSLNASIVHPREVFKAAIQHSAASMICVHNHPSGDPTPSPQDVELTKRLMEAGALVGIEVLDHIVVGKEGNFSLKERGLI